MHAKVRGLVSRAVAAAMIFGLAASHTAPARAAGRGDTTATPIKHLVVIFGENITFDHYFGTYPNATNPPGEPQFIPAAGTPNVNGLNGALLTINPNFLNSANGTGAANPFRLGPSQALTSDQDHDYTPEQQAFGLGLMNAFPEFTGSAGPPPGTPPDTVNTTGLVMAYYDGNTVTALWNYAQKFALNDNHYGTGFGPSTPGALNLISGQTNGISSTENGPSSDWIGDGNGGLTLISDANPIGDVCSPSTGGKVQMGGPNIGNLLNAAGLTWGWFEGGFNLSIVNSNGSTGCNRNTTSTITGSNENDYIPHHQPFQYYASTANPTHARPRSVSAIGGTDAANHQYDIEDFFSALSAGNLPTVTFLKAIGVQDAHPGYSSPLDEQVFVVTVLNTLQQSDFWNSTAVVILYDDSDGWYDHQMGPIINQSNTTADALTGTGACGDGSTALPGVNPATLHAQGRCGFGPRIPLMVISPWAKQNFVDHTLINQTSVIRFIEDNWLGGNRLGGGSADSISGSIQNMFDFTAPNHTKLILSTSTGEPI
jgi:phospholipase C